MRPFPASPLPPMLRRRFLIASATLALGGCAPSGEPPKDPGALPLLGTAPVAPMGKVDFEMPDTRGEAYRFRAETDGHIALLYFGYTFCPDVCPVQMAALGAALRELPATVTDRVRVVFVTVDPDRDTPERLRGWLDAFDSTFVGVRGTPEQIARALDFYRFPAPERSGQEVGYTVGHPAIVYAFTPDDLGRAMYGPETTKAAWIHDLTLMAGHDWAAATAGPTAAEDVDGASGAIEVLDAVVPRPPTATTTSVYLRVRNSGTVADTLLGMSTDVAERASLHEMAHEGSLMRMRPVAGGIPVEAGATLRLEPGALHGMLEGFVAPLPEPGGTVPLLLRFAVAGEIPVAARVVRYEDVGR